MTRYSSTLRKAISLTKAAPVVLLAVVVAAVLAAPVYAGSGIVDHAASSAAFAQASDLRPPEANLPFLFAVYILTWAGFFGYALYMSRRQRDMQRDIDALRQALREREGKDDASS